MTTDGKRHYPVISGIPVLFSQSSRTTHSGATGLLHQNMSIATKTRAVDLEKLNEFITNMFVPTCGNLFHGVKLDGDYPIVPLPSDLPKGLILDVGCNWGRWSIGGAMKGQMVIGVDPHLEALLYAKELARRLIPNNVPFFVACDARHLPFADHAFDGCFSYSVLQHFSRQNMTIILDEISRTLRRGGISEIQMPNRNGAKAFLITHEFQPALAGDTALEGFVPRPTRGVGSWRRDRISG